MKFNFGFFPCDIEIFWLDDVLFSTWTKNLGKIKIENKNKNSTPKLLHPIFCLLLKFGQPILVRIFMLNF